MPKKTLDQKGKKVPLVKSKQACELAEFLIQLDHQIQLFLKTTSIREYLETKVLKLK